MSLLERVLDWATSFAYRPPREIMEPLNLDPVIAKERRALEERRRQHHEEMRQLSLVEAEVAALRVDAEVIARTYHPPTKRDHDVDPGHQPA